MHAPSYVLLASSPGEYRMAGNFRGTQFSQMDVPGCSTHNICPAPPLTARAPRLKSRWNRPKKAASDRSIVLVLSRDQKMARE